MMDATGMQKSDFITTLMPSPSPVNFLYGSETLCFMSFDLFDPYCFLPNEWKHETSGSNKQHLKVFGFHPDDFII